MLAEEDELSLETTVLVTPSAPSSRLSQAGHTFQPGRTSLAHAGHRPAPRDCIECQQLYPGRTVPDTEGNLSPPMVQERRQVAAKIAGDEKILAHVLVA